MKKLIFYSFILTMLVFITSCNKESADVTTDLSIEASRQPDISQLPIDVQEMIQRALSKEFTKTDLADQRNGKRASGVKSKAGVIEFATGDVTGHTKITRTDEGAHIKWHSIGLTPGDAVTMWIILFSQDDYCNPAFVDILWGGGEIVNPDGVFNLESFLANGDNSNSLIGGPGMENAYDFGIHVINRTHGQYIEGSDQLTTFGDCHPVTGCEDLSDSLHPVCP